MMSLEQNQTKRVRVVLADDNKEMREMVIRIVDQECEVVGAFADGRALVEGASELLPEIGIIDISMPIMNGIQAATEIRRRGSAMKSIFLTVNEDRDFVRAAFDAGASAYVIKRCMATDLPAAIKEVLAGRTFISCGCELHDDA